MYVLARACAVLAAFAAIYLPYRLAGDPAIAGDYEHHRVSIGDFRDALHEGEWYPRWSASVNRGLGAATFYFYPPLPYALASVSADIAGDVPHGMRLAAALAAAFGAWSMFGLVRASVPANRGPAPAAFAAVLYAVLPYAVYAAYYRFAWAEYCAMQCLPLLVRGVHDLIARPTRGAAARAVIGAAALGCTHLLTSLIVAPGIAVWVVVAAIRRRSIAIVGRAAVAGALALAIAGAFVVPVIMDIDEIHLEHTLRSDGCRVEANYLFHDEVEAGFARAESKSTMEWILALEATALLFAFLALRRARHDGADLARFAAGVALAIGATWLAEPIWRWMPGVSILQFPARLIGPLGFLAAWSAGVAFAHAHPLGRGAVAFAAAGCTVGSAIVVAAAYPAERGSGSATAGSEFVLREYTPRHLEYDRLIDAFRAHGPRPVVTRGRASVEPMLRRTHRAQWRVRVEGDEPASVILPLFAYPGWHLFVDDTPTPIGDRNPLGLLQCDVPPGEHLLQAVHDSAPSRRYGTWLSALGIVLAIGWVGLHRPRVEPDPPGAARVGNAAAVGLAVAAAGGVIALAVGARPAHAPTHVVVITTEGLTPELDGGWISFDGTGATDSADFARRILESDALSRARADGLRAAAFVEARPRWMPADIHVTEGTGSERVTAARAWLGRDVIPAVVWIHLRDPHPDRIAELLQTLHVAYRFTDAAIAIRGADGRALVKPPGEPLDGEPIAAGRLDPARFAAAAGTRISGASGSARSFVDSLVGVAREPRGPR